METVLPSPAAAITLLKQGVNGKYTSRRSLGGAATGLAFLLAVTACLTASAAPGETPAAPPPAANQRDLVKVDARTEEIIKGALKYLADKQSPNGSWGTTGEEANRRIAMTGYTLMAFLAAGQLPGEGEYGRQVAAGMQFLLDQTQPDGIIGSRNDGQYMYAHGICTIALAELYGQTRSPSIKAKLQRIVSLIVAAQSKEGGWRYRPVSQDADISVTVLSLVAIRAAKNAGLEVPQRTIDDGVKYVKRCYDRRSGGFCYQPNASPGFARTSAAIYSLQVCGLYDDEMVKTGSEYLLKSMTEKRSEQKEWFTYGHFYAAPAQYMVGGETWKRWYESIHAVLLQDVQVDKGRGWAYWEPRRDRGREVGPTFCTAVYTMILSMPYHYIPLYQR